MTTRNKKLIVCAASVLLAVAIFGMLAGTAWAATTKTTAATIAGQGLGFFTNMGTNILLLYGAVYLFQTVASWIMTISGLILDQLFYWNVVLSPNNISVVKEGWTIMRDIANSLFILIILWIAFTIIFNIENLGGKKLLVRVILIALLINFSLVMVSAVFGFANALARPFQEAIMGKDGEIGLSEIIVGKTKVYNVVEAAQSGELAKLAAEEQKKAEASQQAASSGSFLPSTTTVVGACGLGTLVFGLATAGLGAIPYGLSCVGLSLAATELAQIFIPSGSGVGGDMKGVVSMAMGTIFLLLTAFAFLTATIVLLWRFVAMVLIAILAPGAFILHVIPGNYGEKYWKMWLESLFKWAFFAPAFYFLVYIALLVLDRMSTGRDQFNFFLGDFNRIFTLIVFLAFLFAAIGVAKKMGITVADSFVKWGQKAGWAALGFAGGTVARATMPTIGRWGQKLDERMSKIPALRRITGATGIGTGLRGLTGLGRKQALDGQKKYAGMTSEEIQRALGQRAYLTGTDRDAMLLELAKRRAVAPKEGIRGYGEDQMRATVNRLKGLGGDYMNILKANPSIARAEDFEPKDRNDAKAAAQKFGLNLDNNQAAQWHVWDKMSGEDMKNLDTKVFDSTTPSSIIKPDGTPLSKGDLAKEAFIGTARGEQFSGLGRTSKSATGKVNDYLNTDRGKELIAQMAPGAYQYLNLNIAREVGWNPPEQHDKPLAILQGEFDKSKVRLKEYKEKINRLSAADNTKGAAKVRSKAAELAAGKLNLRDELARRGDATGRAADTQYEDMI